MGEEGLEKTQLLKDKNFLIVRPKFRGRKTRTHTPPFLSAKQVWFVKIKDKVSEENTLRFSSVGPENTLRFSSFILKTKSIHPTFIEASYELLPSQENTRLNLFFHKKKKNLLEKGSHGLLPRQENTRHTPIPRPPVLLLARSSCGLRVSDGSLVGFQKRLCLFPREI